MWYTSLSSSSGTCGAAEPPQRRATAAPHAAGRQRHLVPPAPSAPLPPPPPRSRRRPRPRAPPQRLGPRQGQPARFPPSSPPSKRRPQSSSRWRRRPRLAASGWPLEAGGRGGGQGAIMPCGMQAGADGRSPPMPAAKGANAALAWCSVPIPPFLQTRLTLLPPWLPSFPCSYGPTAGHPNVSNPGAATLAMQVGRAHPATGRSPWMPPFQPQAGLNPPLSVLPSCLPTRAPPAKAISRDTTMPAAWNPPWTLGVRVWYVPVKSNALMNLPRVEMARIAPGNLPQIWKSHVVLLPQGLLPSPIPLLQRTRRVLQ